MSARRAARKKPGTPRRFSLRLENKKNLPFGYQRPTTSMAMESATPRTLLRKVLQTQPIVSPLVSEERTSPKPAEPVRRWSLRHIPCSNLEISLPDSAPKEKCHISRVRPVSKKIRLSEFERGVNNQLGSSTAQPSLENISLTKSLEVSFRTPAPLQSAGRKGLIRRPKNYKGINVKDFEGGIEQNLLHTKESAQSYCVDSQTETLLSDAEMHTAATELFAQPQLHRQNEEEVSVAHSHRASIQQSLTGESILASNQTPKQFAKSNGEAEGMESAQKESLTLETESMDEAGIMLKEKIDSPAEEEQESLQDIAGGLLYSSQKKRLTQGYDEVGRVEAVLPESPVTPENVQENLTGNTFMKQLLSTPKYLNTGMGSVRSSTPVQAKVQEAQPGHLSILPHEKPARYSIKEIVTQLIEELDKSVIPTVTGESISEADKEEELFPNEEANQISQRISTETPTVSKRNAKKLERPPTKEIVDQITQQSGKGGEPQEMLDMETEHSVISEAERDCEMSDAETDVEKTDPTVKTPAFVRARAFQCTPLLATPHTLKVSVSRSPIKQHSVKQASKRPERVPRTKRSPALPSSFIKTLFSHYVRMPVAKDAFKAVERCVNLYFKHLSDDLEVYTNHARRKITEPADVELLMRRQGLITDKTPLNVLIERHLPLEYRRLLIPVATSGNKVIPPKLQ